MCCFTTNSTSAPCWAPMSVISTATVHIRARANGRRTTTRTLSWRSKGPYAGASSVASSTTTTGRPDQRGQLHDGRSRPKISLGAAQGIPALSLHGVDDLAVPLSMEQIYARQVAAHGQQNLFVSRTIRPLAHRDSTQTELRRGFDDLVRWVRTGTHPAGDDILNPAAGG